MQRAKTGGHILAIFAETQEKQLQNDSATSFMFMVDLKQLAGVPMLFFSQEFFFSFMTVYLALVVNRKKKDNKDRGRHDSTFYCTCRHTAQS